MVRATETDHWTFSEYIGFLLSALEHFQYKILIFLSKGLTTYCELSFTPIQLYLELKME